MFTICRSIVWTLAVASILTGCVTASNERPNQNAVRWIDAVLAYSSIGAKDLSDALAREAGTVDAWISDARIVPISRICANVAPEREVAEKRSDKISIRTKLEPPGILNGGREHRRIVFEPVELSFDMKIVSLKEDDAIVKVRGEFLDQNVELSEADLRDSFLPGDRKALESTLGISLNCTNAIVAASARRMHKDGYVVILMHVQK